MKNAYLFNIIQETFSIFHAIVTASELYPLRRILKNQYEIVNPYLILDLGCGIGNYMIDEYNHIGIDLNFNYLKRAKLKNKKSNIVLMNGCELGFRNNTFNVVLISSLGHHVNNSNLEKIISETDRVLTEKGYLFFVDVVKPLTKMNWLARLLERLDEGDNFRNEEEYIKILSQHFALEEKGYYTDQLYNSIFFLLKKKNSF